MNLKRPLSILKSLISVFETQSTSGGQSLTGTCFQHQKKTQRPVKNIHDLAGFVQSDGCEGGVKKVHL